MKTNSTLTFGKYKGRTIEDIWSGKSISTDEEIINNYIVEICLFILDNEIQNQKVFGSNFDLTSCANELLFINQSFTERRVKFKNDKIIVEAEDDKIPLAFFKVLDGILGSSFFGFPKFYTKGEVSPNFEVSIHSKNFKFLQADPKYLEWCIENVEHFSIEPNDLALLRLTPCRYFNKFKLKKDSDNIYSLNYAFIELEHELSEKTLIINTNKTSETEFYSNSNFTHQNPEDFSSFCSACHESPCMCSDREQSSSVYDF